MVLPRIDRHYQAFVVGYYDAAHQGPVSCPEHVGWCVNDKLATCEHIGNLRHKNNGLHIGAQVAVRRSVTSLDLRLPSPKHCPTCPAEERDNRHSLNEVGI